MSSTAARIAPSAPDQVAVVQRRCRLMSAVSQVRSWAYRFGATWAVEHVLPLASAGTSRGPVRQVRRRTGREMLPGPVEVLAQRPAGIDPAEGALGGRGSAEKRPLPRCSGAASSVAMSAREEHPVVRRPSARRRRRRCPLDRPPGTAPPSDRPAARPSTSHRPPPRARRRTCSRSSRRCSLTLSATVTRAGYAGVFDGLDDRPLPNMSGMTMNQRVGSRMPVRPDQPFEVGVLRAVAGRIDDDVVARRRQRAVGLPRQARPAQYLARSQRQVAGFEDPGLGGPVHALVRGPS